MANLNMAEVERRLLDNGTVVPRDPTVTFCHELRRANDVTRLKYDTQYNAVTKPHVAFLESLGRVELQELLHKFIRDHPVLASETVSSRKRHSPSGIPPEQEPMSSRKQSRAHPRQQTPPPRRRRDDDDHNVLRTPQRQGSQPSVHHGRLQAVAVAQPSVSQPHVNVVQMQQNPQPALPRQMPLHERAVGHHRERERRTPRHHRDVSPSEIDGVKRIPGDLVDAINQMREPGEYFAKSQSRYLGPFEAYPTNADLPADDEYIILQRIARLPVTRKSVFQQVGSIIT